MFFINIGDNDEGELILKGLATLKALELFDKGIIIYNFDGGVTTREEIVEFLNSGYKSIYD